MNTIVSIVNELCKQNRNIEYVILRSTKNEYSFQPNYESLDVGDVDLFDNVVVKKMSYYTNENNI